jgi:hypothetical protein
VKYVAAISYRHAVDPSPLPPGEGVPDLSGTGEGPGGDFIPPRGIAEAHGPQRSCEDNPNIRRH